MNINTKIEEQLSERNTILQGLTIKSIPLATPVPGRSEKPLDKVKDQTQRKRSREREER